MTDDLPPGVYVFMPPSMSMGVIGSTRPEKDGWKRGCRRGCQLLWAMMWIATVTLVFINYYIWNNDPICVTLGDVYKPDYNNHALCEQSSSSSSYDRCYHVDSNNCSARWYDTARVDTTIITIPSCTLVWQTPFISLLSASLAGVAWIIAVVAFIPAIVAAPHRRSRLAITHAVLSVASLIASILAIACGCPSIRRDVWSGSTSLSSTWGYNGWLQICLLTVDVVTTLWSGYYYRYQARFDAMMAHSYNTATRKGGGVDWPSRSSSDGNARNSNSTSASNARNSQTRESKHDDTAR